MLLNCDHSVSRKLMQIDYYWRVTKNFNGGETILWFPLAPGFRRSPYAQLLRDVTGAATAIRGHTPSSGNEHDAPRLRSARVPFPQRLPEGVPHDGTIKMTFLFVIKRYAKEREKWPHNHFYTANPFTVSCFSKIAFAKWRTSACFVCHAGQ